MDETQVLTSVAEVAIAFAGFSGVVTVFRRNPDPWLPEDRYRLTFLILCSFATAAFAFLPFVLWEIAGAEHRVWRVSSAAASIFYVWLINWARSLDARIRADDPAIRQRVSPVLLSVVLYIVTPVVLALSLANAAFWGAFTPYLVAEVWGLVVSGIMFTRILQSALR